MIGLVPAAGHGTRISPLPLSKELFPIGFQIINGATTPRPKVVTHYLLEKFKNVGISKAYIVLREGKWDIPAYFGDGALVNMHLGYLMMREPFGPPFSLDQAYPFLRDEIVAFGFPDILFTPENMYKQLLDHQESIGCDVVLGLLPAHNPHIMDMVEVGKNGKIHRMYLKPETTSLTLCWLCAVWTPVFTHFMHDYLQTYRRENNLQTEKADRWEQEDLTVGAVIQAAVTDGLEVYGLAFPNGQYIDIGTPGDLVKSLKMFGWDLF